MSLDVITHQDEARPDNDAIEYPLPANRFASDVPDRSDWIGQFVGLDRESARMRLAEYWAGVKSPELVQFREKLLSTHAPVSLVVYGQRQHLCLGDDGYDPQSSWWLPWLLPSPLDPAGYGEQLDRFGLRGDGLFEQLVRYFGGLCRPFMAWGVLPPIEWSEFDPSWMMDPEPHRHWDGALAVYTVNGDALLVNAQGETAWWLPQQDTVVAAGSLSEFVVECLVRDGHPPQV